MEFHHRNISRAIIIDDDPDARDSYEYAIEDLGIQTHQVTNPFSDIKKFISELGESDVLLCDYHLRKHGTFAPCDGDKLVSECYKARVPGVLCTTFTDTIVRRDYLRFIPGIIRSGNPEPEDLLSAWSRCAREIDGEFEPSRQPWRTLVRVVEADLERQFVYVIVPPWDVRQKVRVDIDSLPVEIRARVEPDRRFHALVNTGAESFEDLYFCEWETE